MNNREFVDKVSELSEEYLGSKPGQPLEDEPEHIFNLLSVISAAKVIEDANA